MKQFLLLFTFVKILGQVCFTQFHSIHDIYCLHKATVIPFHTSVMKEYSAACIGVILLPMVDMIVGEAYRCQMQG